MMNKLEETKQPIIKTLESVNKIEEVKKPIIESMAKNAKDIENTNKKIKELSAKDIKKMEKEHPMPKAETKQELNKKLLEEVKKKESDLMKSFVKKSAWAKKIDSDAYFEGENYVKMVASGDCYGMLWEGAAGLGKSYSTLQILRESGVDFAFISSKATPQAIYIWLYENRDKICVMDDVAGWDSNADILGFLKAALWDDGKGLRMINYLTTKPIKDMGGHYVENKFEFTGRIIILTNSLNRKNPHVMAVVSRMLHNRIELDFKEKMNIIRAITEQKWGTLSNSERKEIYSFIEEHVSPSNVDLNFRTLIKIYQFYEYSKKIKDTAMWKRLALKYLKKDDMLLLVEELEADKDMLPKDREERFYEITGKSRSTYHRYKTKIKPKLKIPNNLEVVQPKKDLTKEKINS